MKTCHGGIWHFFMKIWMFSRSFFVGGSCWNLQQKLNGGVSIKITWLGAGRYPHQWKRKVAFMSINEQMPCVSTGFFLLLFCTSSCFIRLPLPGSDYPQSLNPMRKLPASPESASLQFIALLPHTHNEVILSPYGWGCCHVTCFTRVRFEMALVFFLGGGPTGEMCVSEFIVKQTTYCGSWARLWLSVQMILHPNI